MRHTLATAALVVAMLVVASPAGGATAGLSAEDLGLSIEVGFDGRQVPGAMLPVTIEITPTTLFDGVIEVASTTRTVERIPIEATAGATRRLHVLAPSDSPPRITFIPSGGGEPLVVRPRDDTSSVALVGVVGGVPAGFPVVDEAVTQRPIVPVTVDEAWLPRGAAALSTLSALVVDTGTLADLSEEARRGIAAAVGGGLDLVVTANDAAADPTLGLPWSPVTALAATDADGVTTVTPADAARPITANGSVMGAALLVGQGQVTVVGVAAGSPGLGRDTALWQPLLSAGPIGRTDTVRDGDFTGGLGLNLPSVGMLTLFLLAYVVVIGPVTGLSLSRLKRPELAWVVVPAVTLVFSGAAFFLASASQPSVALVSRTLTWADGAGTETASVLLRAPREGSHTVTFDGDWTIRNEAFGSSAAVSRQPGGTTVKVDLEALDVSSLKAQRPMAGPPPLTVTAVTTDETAAEVELTITNDGPTAYDQLMILAGGELRMLDQRLNPGDAITETIRPSVMPAWQSWSEQGWSLEGGHAFRGLLISGVAGASPWSGQIHVVAHAPVGLTASGVTANGGSPQEQGTNVVVSVRPQLSGDVPAWAFDRSIRTTGWIHDGVWVEAPSDEIIQRHRLPNGVPRDGTLELVDVEGRFGAGVAGEVVCESVEERDPDGNLLGVVEECVEVPGFAPDFECPPDAVSCSFDGNTFEICFPNGTCEGGTGPVAVPDAVPAPERLPGVAASGIAAWDWERSSWAPIDQALADGAASRFLSVT
ncbi:MAG TPA: hypothetical protein VGA36_06205, partial [Nitriliruptorales bacterium]